jgi:transcription termination/antitermination protein NusG
MTDQTQKKDQEPDQDLDEEQTEEQPENDGGDQNVDQTADQNADQQEEKQNEGIIVISEDVGEEAKWYVVHTYSGHEHKVAVTLKQRVEAAGFTDKISKIFIPHQQKIVISEGRKRSVDERLFPGYVIIQMVMSDDTWHLVRSTRGVTGFVGTGTTPTPLPESEVKTLMKFTKMEAPKFEAKFSVGDSVKIIDGPFSEFLGKVDEVNDEQGKVKVLVSVFGRETPVELDFTQVSSL